MLATGRLEVPFDAWGLVLLCGDRCRVAKSAAWLLSCCRLICLALNSASALELACVGGNSVRYEGNPGPFGRAGDSALVLAAIGSAVSWTEAVGGSRVIRSVFSCNAVPGTFFEVEFLGNVNGPFARKVS